MVELTQRVSRFTFTQRIYLPLRWLKTALSSELCASSKCDCSCVTVPKSFMHMGQRNPSLISALVAMVILAPLASSILRPEAALNK